MVNVSDSRIIIGPDSAYMDYCICATGNRPLVVSFYKRELETLRAICAGFNAKYPEACLLSNEQRVKLSFTPGEGYDVFISPVDKGKDPFYHAVVINKELGKRYLITTEDRKEEDFYNFLMENFNFPLLREWARELYDWSSRAALINSLSVVHTRKEERTISIRGNSYPMDRIIALSFLMSEERLKEGISRLLKEQRIRISSSPQKPLEFNGMDDYFNKYGSKIVENLERQLEPLVPYMGNVDDFTLKHKRLFPQQAAMVHGVKALLYGTGNKKERRKTRSRYGILNEGMGTGKTLQGASICEAVGIEYLFKTVQSLKEIYKSRDNVHYRIIVMCPGHLVEKWAAEIKNEIPYSRVKILENFQEVIDLWLSGPARNGREFFVISKDKAKLSYQEMPAPTKVRRWTFMKRVCVECRKEIRGKACSCGSTKWKLEATDELIEGMACPCCNNVLLPYGRKEIRDEFGDIITLMPQDFAKHREDNSVCVYCGERLWKPYVRNYGESPYKRYNPWRRVSHYANKAQKGTKTVWVHEEYEDAYFRSVGMTPINYLTGSEVRRIDPATFIKKHMKNFFDIAIFDEVHTLKGGDTAQGHAMHALVKASKRQLALTGTIAGGYAHHLFYMLYRLDPARMKSKGFDWGSVTKFSAQYGCTSTTYEAEKDYQGEYNVQSRGKKIGEPKCTPGISPLIYTDFLLDKTVMLDISDMSSHLPALKENVVLVDFKDELEKQVHISYDRVVDNLKELTRKGYGMTVLSTMLQFSLSYLDKPYGVLPIMDPLNGRVLQKPDNFEEFASTDRLLSKEEKLVELVGKELEEGRNCFVFAEYTNSPQTCVTKRLKEILESRLNLKKGEVEILESSSVATDKREDWIHKKAADGMKVCITNPRCVETGLDFCFMHEGKEYNFPTIFFYQLGYSLFTIWQASRRHYRLNQKEECRTYYMAYRWTIQEAVISLIAEKMSATSAIQGKFSAEGLSAMAQGVDARTKLAQALSDMDSATGKELQAMFDVINDNVSEQDESGYVPMKLLHEVLGDDAIALEQTVEEMEESNAAFGGNAFDLFDFLFDEEENTAPVNEGKKEGDVIPVDAIAEDVIAEVVELDEAMVMVATVPKRRGKKVIVAEGQMMLF